MPRAPVSSTLLAGSPATNWRVFCSMTCFCSSMFFRSDSLIGDTLRTGCMVACTPKALARRRQRNAHAASQSGDAGDGSCDASCTLRDAVLGANAAPAPVLIRFAVGARACAQER